MSFVASQANQPNFQLLPYSYERTPTQTTKIPSKKIRDWWTLGLGPKSYKKKVAAFNTSALYPRLFPHIECLTCNAWPWAYRTFHFYFTLIIRIGLGNYFLFCLKSGYWWCSGRSFPEWPSDVSTEGAFQAKLMRFLGHGWCLRFLWQ